MGKDACFSGFMMEDITEQLLNFIFKGTHVGVMRKKIFQGHELRHKPTYSETLRPDIFLINIPGFPDGLVISIKRLTEKNSGTMKLHYHLDDEIPAYPCPVILMLLGDGWTQGDWIEKARQSIDGIHFLDMWRTIDELVQWALTKRDEIISGNYQYNLNELKYNHDLLKHTNGCKQMRLFDA